MAAADKFESVAENLHRPFSPALLTVASHVTLALTLKTGKFSEREYANNLFRFNCNLMASGLAV